LCNEKLRGIPQHPQRGIDMGVAHIALCPFDGVGGSLPLGDYLFLQLNADSWAFYLEC